MEKRNIRVETLNDEYKKNWLKKMQEAQTPEEEQDEYGKDPENNENQEKGNWYD